jgi:hypothetical protein
MTLSAQRLGELIDGGCEGLRRRGDGRNVADPLGGGSGLRSAYVDMHLYALN